MNELFRKIPCSERLPGTDIIATIVKFVGKKYNAKLISKAPEMFEMLKMVSEGINNMSFDQLELLNDDIEQLLKEATEL